MSFRPAFLLTRIAVLNCGVFAYSPLTIKVSGNVPAQLRGDHLELQVF